MGNSVCVCVCVRISVFVSCVLFSTRSEKRQFVCCPKPHAVVEHRLLKGWQRNWIDINEYIYIYIYIYSGRPMALQFLQELRESTEKKCSYVRRARRCLPGCNRFFSSMLFGNSLRLCPPFPSRWFEKSQMLSNPHRLSKSSYVILF